MLKGRFAATLLIIASAAACSKEREAEQPVDTTLPEERAVSPESPAPDAAVNEVEQGLEAEGPMDYIGEDAQGYEGEAAEPDLQAPADEEPIANLPVSPRGNPGSWATDADYPQAALREHRQGTTGFQVTVGPDGRVVDCTLTAPSGSPDLDEATCRNVTRRARFRPAMENGVSVQATYSNRVRWVLPE
jgi:protein TonB